MNDEETPAKRRKSIDMRKCVVCQERNSCKKVRTNSWTGKCYKSATNKTFSERSRKRFENRLPPAEEKQNNPIDGGILDGDITATKCLRSNTTGYDNTRCIICQEPGGKLRTVRFIKTGQRMLEVARKLEDPQLFLRMNNIPSAVDVVANDMKFHLNCWVKVQRKVASSSVEVQEIDDLSRVLADIEIVNTVDYLLHEANTIIDLNSLNTTYKNLLRNETEYQNYKQYLKQLVEENVLEIVFFPSSSQKPIWTNLFFKRLRRSCQYVHQLIWRLQYNIWSRKVDTSPALIKTRYMDIHRFFKFTTTSVTASLDQTMR